MTTMSRCMPIANSRNSKSPPHSDDHKIVIFFCNHYVAVRPSSVRMAGYFVIADVVDNLY